MVSKYLKYNPESGLNILLVKMNNESRIEHNSRMKPYLPSINGETPYANESLFAYPAS
jgi:hypothetical protein